jgi:hypothetical protein
LPGKRDAFGEFGEAGRLLSPHLDFKLCLNHP